MLAEVVDALVLQAHAVEHAPAGLSHARIVVTLARLERSTLHDNASDFIQRHEILKLQPVAKRTRGCHHGILQPQVSYVHI